MTERKITTIRIVEELDELIEKTAKKKGISRNALIIEAIWKYVEKPNQPRRD